MTSRRTAEEILSREMVPASGELVPRLVVRAVPPALQVRLDLPEWLERDEQLWRVPVPAPFAVRGSQLVAFPGDPAASFDPREYPWLPTDFAHLSTETEAKALPAVVKFADFFGLTGSWSDGEPPTEEETSELLRQSAELRETMEAYRQQTDDSASAEFKGSVELGADPTDLVRPGRALLSSLLQTSTAALEVGLAVWPGVTWLQADVTFSIEWSRPPDLLDVMRLMLLADFSAGLRVNECPKHGCGKLFIWPQGTKRSRLAGRGRQPRFCSRKHATTFAQREKRQRDTRAKKGKG